MRERGHARKANVNSLAKARALSQKCVKSRGERTCAALVDRIEADYFIYPPATHTHMHTNEHIYEYEYADTQTDGERAKNALGKAIKT